MVANRRLQKGDARCRDLHRSALAWCSRGLRGHFDGVTVVCKLYTSPVRDITLYGRRCRQLLLIRRTCYDLISGRGDRQAPDGAESRTDWQCPGRNSSVTPFDGRSPPCCADAGGGGRRGGQPVSPSGPRHPGGRTAVPVKLLSPRRSAHAQGRLGGPWGEALLAVEGWVGSTRLIDNVPLVLGAVS